MFSVFLKRQRCNASSTQHQQRAENQQALLTQVKTEYKYIYDGENLTKLGVQFIIQYQVRKFSIRQKN